jgi:hypothetical protein
VTLALIALALLVLFLVILAALRFLRFSGRARDLGDELFEEHLRRQAEQKAVVPAAATTSHTTLDAS